MIKGFSHIGLSVSDMARSLAFYRDILGFPVVEELKLDTGLHLAHLEVQPGCTVELLHHGGELKPVPEGTLGFVHLAFSVDDLDATYAELVGKGVEFTTPPKEGVGRAKRIAFCKGPDGEVLELAQS